MFTIIGLMLTGMLAGYFLRNKDLSRIQALITLLIWVLLFILGIEVGSNDNIISGLHTIGLEALLLTLGGTLGSVIAAWALWRKLSLSPDPSPVGRGESGCCSAPLPTGEGSGERPEGLHALKGSLIIVGFFALGTVFGLSRVLPFDIAQTDVSFYALAALMFSVGVSVGSDPQTLKSFRSLNPRLVLLPVMTITGTLTGSALISLLLTHRSLADCLAIGSGFGYYSLSSIFITEYRGAELGTIALLANISREILTLLAAPLLVRWFGNLAPISAGGATTMDTTLPVITRTAGQQFVVVSIFHGFIVDFSVPWLVTLFCSL
ncbi:MAG: lysine exporter LysO family protein [Bacteroides sp.]|nr:lysine exporter LysO family protein [Bacteroides sp.]